MQDKDSNKIKGCPAVLGVYVGFKDHKVYSGPLRCNSWSCEYCAPRKLSKLRKRLYNGEISLQGIPKYGFKFATLTFGGIEARKPFLMYSTAVKVCFPKPDQDFDTWEAHGPELQTRWIFDKYGNKKRVPVYNFTAMYEKMMEVFNTCRTSLVRKYGKFMYFRVHEPHQDGVPHLHVLFAGKNVIPKSFYDDLQRLWQNGGLGWVKLSTIKDKNGRPIKSFNDAKHAVNYLCKYLTKGMQTAGKYKRVFSSSRGALMPIQKQEWEIMEIIMGRVDDKGTWVEEVCPLDQAVEDVLHDIRRKPWWDESQPVNVLDVVLNRHYKYHTNKER